MPLFSTEKIKLLILNLSLPLRLGFDFYFSRSLIGSFFFLVIYSHFMNVVIV